MQFSDSDLYIRQLKFSDINNRYIKWFSDNDVTEFLEARNISIAESKSYLKNGHLTGMYYLFAVCLVKDDLHIGNVKIGPIKKLKSSISKGLLIFLNSNIFLNK